jgi:hypothetical protein
MAVPGAAARIIVPAMYSAGFDGKNPLGKDVAEEEPRNQSHGKWFDHPVHERCDRHSFGFLAHCLNRGEIDFHHHGNQPDEYGDGQIDLAAGPEFESGARQRKRARIFRGQFR